MVGTCSLGTWAAWASSVHRLCCTISSDQEAEARGGRGNWRCWQQQQEVLEEQQLGKSTP